MMGVTDGAVCREGRRRGMTPVQTDFSQGSIPKIILRLAVPMTTAQLVNILYSVIDRIYLGHIPGTGHLALTGLGLTLPII